VPLLALQLQNDKTKRLPTFGSLFVLGSGWNKYIKKGVGRRELMLIYIIPLHQKNGNKKAAFRPPLCFLNRVTDLRKVMYFDCSLIIPNV
jgi:hypothetical protein